MFMKTQYHKQRQLFILNIIHILFATISSLMESLSRLNEQWNDTFSNWYLDKFFFFCNLDQSILILKTIFSYLVSVFTCFSEMLM